MHLRSGSSASSLRPPRVTVFTRGLRSDLGLLFFFVLSGIGFGRIDPAQKDSGGHDQSLRLFQRNVELFQHAFVFFALAILGRPAAGQFPVGDEDRFGKLGIPIKPWRSDNAPGYDLVLGQRGHRLAVLAGAANTLRFDTAGDGWLAVADARERQIKLWRQGALLAEVDFAGLGLMDPRGMSIAQQTLYVADGAGRRVISFRLRA